MKTKPTDVSWEPIACPFCLRDKRAQRMWLAAATLVLICPIHEEVFSARYLAHTVSGDKGNG